jgi:hypothetical protein
MELNLCRTSDAWAQEQPHVMSDSIVNPDIHRKLTIVT